MILRLQHFSIHDGTGIRTVVFLKGCPLRCRWCSNPESQSFKRELGWNRNRCINCGNCAAQYSGKICIREEGGLRIAEGFSLSVEEAERICPAHGLTVFGVEADVQAILDAVEKDMVFYGHSGGGMTLSGGEPLAQPELSLTLLKEAKRRHIHTAIETTGYGAYENLEQMIPFLDELIYDLKCMDDEKHRAGTGVGNRIILDNFSRVKKEYPELAVLVRTPVIPGFNDSHEDILAIMDFIAPLANVRYELLEYHRLGEAKLETLGRNNAMQDMALDPALFAELKAMVEAVNENG